MADYISSHSGPTIDQRVDLAATNQADIAALKARMSSAESSIATKADASTVNAELADKADTSTVNAALATKADKTTVEAALATKQDKLVSGTNIKTINNESILGGGNIDLVTTGDFDDYKQDVGDDIADMKEYVSDAAFGVSYDEDTGRLYVVTLAANTRVEGATLNETTGILEITYNIA